MKGWQLAVVLSGCVVNGKPYGPGSSSPSSSPTSSPAAEGDRSDLYTPDGRVREDARWYKEPPYLSAPADP